MLDGVEKASLDADKGVRNTTDKLREIFTYQPKKKELKPIPSSYCYRTLLDIICYSEPLPGADDRLVAYQGTVLQQPPPPPKPVMPISRPQQTAGASGAAAPNVPPPDVLPKLTPVYVVAPPEVKGESTPAPVNINSPAGGDGAGS